MRNDRIHVHPIARINDNRGSFSELFRTHWFIKRGFIPLQINMSTSRRNVLRGLHYHKHQTDVWFPVSGRFQAAFIYDLFTDRPKHVSMELSGDSPQAILIPPNVAHGYLALTDNAIMAYAVDRYYDPEDEHTLWWDGYSIPWRCKQPILSDRDILASPANQSTSPTTSEEEKGKSTIPAGDAVLCWVCHGIADHYHTKEEVAADMYHKKEDPQ